MNRITYGEHLRGFVQRQDNSRVRTRINKDGTRCPVMHWYVVNTVTGKVITSDGTCCTVERAIRECDRLVGAARVAWMHSYRFKDLARGGEGRI